MVAFSLKTFNVYGVEPEFQGSAFYTLRRRVFSCIHPFTPPFLRVTTCFMLAHTANDIKTIEEAMSNALSAFMAFTSPRMPSGSIKTTKPSTVATEK